MLEITRDMTYTGHVVQLLTHPKLLIALEDGGEICVDPTQKPLRILYRPTRVGPEFQATIPDIE